MQRKRYYTLEISVRDRRESHQMVAHSLRCLVERPEHVITRVWWYSIRSHWCLSLPFSLNLLRHCDKTGTFLPVIQNVIRSDWFSDAEWQWDLKIILPQAMALKSVLTRSISHHEVSFRTSEASGEWILYKYAKQALRKVQKESETKLLCTCVFCGPIKVNQSLNNLMFLWNSNLWKTLLPVWWCHYSQSTTELLWKKNFFSLFKYYFRTKIVRKATAEQQVCRVTTVSSAQLRCCSFQVFHVPLARLPTRRSCICRSRTRAARSFECFS